MDGQACCMGCGRPPAYTFGNLETGYQGLMCEEHSKALDRRHPERFERLDGQLKPEKEKLARDITGAYSRARLQGHRLPDRTVEHRSNGSLVTDRQREQLERLREQKLARQWESTIEPDPWNR